MMAQRWFKVRELLAQALDLEPHQREAFLDRTCSSDPSLREELELLLRSSEDIRSTFLQVTGQQVKAKETGPGFSPEATQATSDETTATRSFTGGQRLPWYVLLMAAISIVGNLFLVYYDVCGLRSGGLLVDEKTRGIFVTYLEPNGPADQAGLLPGDRIVEADHQPVTNLVDWVAQRGKCEANHPFDMVVERQQQTIRTSLQVRGVAWEELSEVSRLSEAAYLLSKLITLAIGLIVVLKNPPEFVARLGGWVLVVMSVVYQPFPWGFAASLRSLPWLLAVPVMVVYVSAAFRTPLLLAFFCLFPRRLFASRWVWAAFSAGPILATLYGFFLLVMAIYTSEPLGPRVPAWALTAMGAQSLVYLVAVLVVLPVSYLRLENATDRRKLRVVCSGTLCGLLFYVPQVLSTLGGTQTTDTNSFFVSNLLYIVSPLGYVVFPIAFAYAILRQRLFNIQVIIRRGLQYTLARQSLLSLLPTIAGVVVIDLVLHGRTPLFTILRSRGPIYAGVALVAGAALLRRKTLLAAIDRRFFRDKYDAQQLFHDIVNQIRVAESLEQVSPMVADRIADALHTTYCAVILRNPGEAYYQVLALSDQEQLPYSGRQVEVTQSRVARSQLSMARHLGRDLPGILRDFLSGAEAELFLPISLKAGTKEAFLVLGAKLSEEPYGREDRALLENVAAALALLVERASGSLAGRVFEECPVCGRCYESGASDCAEHGKTLKVVACPRVFSNRYRLEQKLGEGGMGRVYRATDLALGRSVAVKMIQEQFSGDFEAIERFRREAQISAHFAHANIVTVFDFGIEGDDRAFLVMELLAGTTLREELHIHQKLEPSRIIMIFEQICAGVSAAHAVGVVHRDLKPDNIFLDISGPTLQVKITDFGIAKNFRQSRQDTLQTRTGVRIGTFKYMSPEQLEGQELSPMWDIWSLSVVAFECLCGKTPFPEQQSSSRDPRRFHAHEFTEHALLPNVPLQGFFENAFHRDKAIRPQTVGAFWETLRESLGFVAT
jgi:eukaryotic-like serine/threonine-protein kinase